MNRSLLPLTMFLLIIMFGIVPPIALSSVTEGEDTIAVDNGYIKVVWDLKNGAAIKNIYGVCKDFKGTSVGSKGISTIRSDGQTLSIETVMWDIISDNNPWYGKAVGTQASYQVLEETSNYTTIQFTYTLGDPFPGLKVIKTYRIYNASFIIDFNMTLENTGSSPITIDLSSQWNRPIGPMIEIVSVMGKKRDESRFIMYENGTISTSPISQLGYGPALNVSGVLKGIGIFDTSKDVSPWGFMIALFMVDQETISKTRFVWPELDAGGSPSTIIRVEYANLELQPGESEDYHMKIYAGPLHYEYLKKIGISRSDYDKIFYSPEFSPRIPCRVVKISLKYNINIDIETEGGTGIPKATLLLQDPYTGDLYNQMEINSNSFTFGIPFTNTTYNLKIEPESGVTLDGLGEYEFIGWVLPNGTTLTDPSVNLTLVENMRLTLKFKIRGLARLNILFVTPDGSALPQQAEDINFSILSFMGELVYQDVSSPGSRNITVKDQRTTPPKPGLKTPDTYVLQVPLKAGIYSLEKILLNGKPIDYQKVGDYAQASFSLDKGGIYEIKVVYSSGGVAGGGGGLIIWIAIIVILVALIVIAMMIKSKKK